MQVDLWGEERRFCEAWGKIYTCAFNSKRQRDKALSYAMLQVRGKHNILLAGLNPWKSSFLFLSVWSTLTETQDSFCNRTGASAVPKPQNFFVSICSAQPEHLCLYLHGINSSFIFQAGKTFIILNKAFLCLGPKYFLLWYNLQRVVVLQTWSYRRIFCIYSPHWIFQGLGLPHRLWETCWLMAVGLSNLYIQKQDVIPDNKCSFIPKNKKIKN